ncbi:hypothetical protein [Yinghuangia sp. YIM S10712]|uniref:hypothetical protein n=1 Tax=Yinghuangia sp. YIM S10712 TaxID=3436930 RepID=UPI003F53D804
MPESAGTLGVWLHEQRVITGTRSIVARDIADGPWGRQGHRTRRRFLRHDDEISRGTGIALYGREGACDTTIAVDFASVTSRWDKKTKRETSTDDFRTVHPGVDGETSSFPPRPASPGHDIEDGPERLSWIPSERFGVFNGCNRRTQWRRSRTDTRR